MARYYCCDGELQKPAGVMEIAWMSRKATQMETPMLNFAWVGEVAQW
jgi:hypothetical protein